MKHIYTRLVRSFCLIQVVKKTQLCLSLLEIALSSFFFMHFGLYEVSTIQDLSCELPRGSSETCLLLDQFIRG